MSSVKTIKEVDEGVWGRFKGLAARSNLKMGVFFKVLIDGYESNARDSWDRILNSPKLLSDKEAKEMHREIKALRKEYGFRI